MNLGLPTFICILAVKYVIFEAVMAEFHDQAQSVIVPDQSSAQLVNLAIPFCRDSRSHDTYVRIQLVSE